MRLYWTRRLREMVEGELLPYHKIADSGLPQELTASDNNSLDVILRVYDGTLEHDLLVNGVADSLCYYMSRLQYPN